MFRNVASSAVLATLFVACLAGSAVAQCKVTAERAPRLVTTGPVVDSSDSLDLGNEEHGAGSGSHATAAGTETRGYLAPDLEVHQGNALVSAGAYVDLYVLGETISCLDALVEAQATNGTAGGSAHTILRFTVLVWDIIEDQEPWLEGQGAVGAQLNSLREQTIYECEESVYYYCFEFKVGVEVKIEIELLLTAAAETGSNAREPVAELS